MQANCMLPKMKDILNEVSWGVKLKLLKDIAKDKQSRRVGISSYRYDRRSGNGTGATSLISEDSNMKMKLFRLMYETIRDSDMKVKRAELIKNHYTNSTIFDIGFILGDVTDKFNTMTDITVTLNRLYDEWKPIEHINAYEQIANKGIEISHLVDMIRMLNKKTNSSGHD